MVVTSFRSSGMMSRRGGFEDMTVTYAVADGQGVEVGDVVVQAVAGREFADELDIAQAAAAVVFGDDVVVIARASTMADLHGGEQ